MTEQMTSTATFTSWDETPGFDDGAPLPRLATAEVAFAYDGEVTGTSECRYVLHYGADGTGTAVGFETITGSRDGAEGTLTLRHECRFASDGVTTDLLVVAGTGAFEGVTGTGTFQVGHGGKEWSWGVGD